MTVDELRKGDWYAPASSASTSRLFRYEGQAPSGGYIFSRFNSGDPEEPGEVIDTIEIFNLDGLEPLVS